MGFRLSSALQNCMLEMHWSVPRALTPEGHQPPALWQVDTGRVPVWSPPLEGGWACGLPQTDRLC